MESSAVLTPNEPEKTCFEHSRSIDLFAENIIAHSNIRLILLGAKITLRKRRTVCRLESNSKCAPTRHAKYCLKQCNQQSNTARCSYMLIVHVPENENNKTQNKNMLWYTQTVMASRGRRQKLFAPATRKTRRSVGTCGRSLPRAGQGIGTRRGCGREGTGRGG